MKGSLLIAAALFMAALAFRPEAPEDTRALGGDLSSAMATLAEAGESGGSRGRRAMGEGYAHWSEGVSKGEMATAPKRPAPPSPTVAAFVGIASVVGLRDVAALGLYLLFNEAEHRGDWELCVLCLEAIPLVDPHFVEAYTIAALFFMEHDRARSEAILRKGLQWNPDDWELLHDAAWLHLRLTPTHEPEPAKALPYLRRIVTVRHPFFVRRTTALVLFHLGHRAEAEAILAAMAADPSAPEADRRNALSGLEAIRRGEDRFALMVERRRERLRRAAPRPPFVHHGHGAHHDHHHGHHHGHGH